MKFLCVVVASSLFLLPAPSVFAQSKNAEWESLNQEIHALYQTGQYDRAVIVAKKALDQAEKSFDSNHPIVATSLNNLALLYDSQNKYAQAEPLYKRALAIDEKNFGPDHPEVATSLNNLAMLYVAQGQYALAEPLYERSLAIYEKFYGPVHSDVAVSLNNLARLYTVQGRYAQAKRFYKRSLAILEKVLGPDHPDVAVSLNNFAGLYYKQGHYTEAEPLFKRSLAIKEKVLGPDHPDVATSLNDLALLLQTQGKYLQAEPLFKRSLAIDEKSFGPDHPEVALGLNNLAELYRSQGRYREAEPYYKRSLAIREKVFGPNHPEVAESLNNLAGLYDNQGRYAQAEPFFKRSLAIWEKVLGPDHPHVAISLNNLAGVLSSQGQYAQAEPLYKRSLAIREKALGPNHRAVALALNNLADMYGKQGQYAQSLSMVRRASSIYRERIVSGGANEVAVQEATMNRFGFIDHLNLLSKNPNKEDINKITDESFQIVQLAQFSGTASAIAKMAVRFASSDDALAGLIKHKQDVGERRSKAEAQLVAASSKPSQERKMAAEQGLRDEIARMVSEITIIDAELTRRFPDYQKLTRPEPLSVGQVRALLKPGEAMLVYALGKTSFLWLVKSEGALFMPLDVDVKDVSSQVASIRKEMEFDSAGRLAKVSVRVLYDLYQKLFSPVASHFRDVHHVILVPAGPLQSLPFGMLVARQPPEIGSVDDYRQVEWLAKRYAFSVLPSVGSIQAFRHFAKTSASQEVFAGFGDPLIGREGSATRGKYSGMDAATVFRNSARSNVQTEVLETEIADVEVIRKAQRLPETAEELRAMAKILNSGPKSLWLQEKATETEIKSLDLSKYRTLAFATHGLMAGEIGRVGESGLILTPPQEGSVKDDGYLSASEIAGLKLNADWIVLSACNTAAPDGTPGAEGLSGLAKAFFYAGARSLLVSHWPVASDATVLLTTALLREYEANPAQGKSEAHRKAMMALMATPNRPEYAHPLFWAPFVVVGEGGAVHRRN